MLGWMSRIQETVPYLVSHFIQILTVKCLTFDHPKALWVLYKINNIHVVS